jgi:RNA polymerase sigma-70 factor, ECF subfamily
MMPTMPASAEIIAAVQPLVPALRRYARALLRDRDDADDLVQDALERAIAGWHRRRTTGSVKAWLYAIVHNLAVDRMRRYKRRGATEPLDAIPEAALAMPAGQEASIERRDAFLLIASLPEDQRAVLLLIGVEELSYAEAATVLDVPQGTVMSRLARARERLRRMMEEGPDAMRQPALRIVS